ncbi:MAG TPA: hypothetical protein VLC74_10270 [Rhizomicrobium sp.]|nr:hypothetical protein [Rhizomicrobium sp.]
MNKIPVGKAVAYAYRFTLAEIGTIIGLAWLPLVLMAVVQFLPFVFGNPMAPAENATAQGREQLENLLRSVLLLLLYSIVYVPVTRQALGSRKGTAVIHFALGIPELRVFGALCLFFLVLMIIVTGIGLGALLLGGLAMANKSAGFSLLVALLVLFAVLAFCYVTVRLSFLILPVTVAEEQISLSRGWILARGNFWRILAVLLAVLLPLYLINFIGIVMIVGPQLVAPLPTNTALAEQAIAARFGMIGQHMPGYLGLTLILAPFSIGLGVGASVFGYRTLAAKPMEAGAPVAG